MNGKKMPGPQIKEKQGEEERWESKSERGGERGLERGECEKPGCSVSAPGSAACYFSCAWALASSPCSHAIVTPLVWWHGTWAAFTLQLKVSQFSIPPSHTDLTFLPRCDLGGDKSWTAWICGAGSDLAVMWRAWDDLHLNAQKALWWLTSFRVIHLRWSSYVWHRGGSAVPTLARRKHNRKESQKGELVGILGDALIQTKREGMWWSQNQNVLEFKQKKRNRNL